MTESVENLVQRLHAKRSGKGWIAKCPVHDDREPSVSIREGRDGCALLKCHAGCSTDDVLAAIGLKPRDLFVIGSNNGLEPLKQKPQQKTNEKNAQQFNWQECVAALKPKDLVRLGNERWWSRAFCRWLRDEKKIGLYKSHFAFPVERDGKIVAAKYKWGPGPNDWAAHPEGQGAACFILGDPKRSKNVHLDESQWDVSSLADRTDWFRDPDNHAFVATPGAGNAKLVKGLIPPGASVLAWPQNDKPGENWLQDLVQCAGTPISKALVPMPHKDLGDWCKAGASAEDIYNAWWRNERVEAPKPRASTLDQLLTETVAALKEHITFASEHQPVVIACWIAHAHCIEQFYCTGYLSISSPIKRCGKSNLLKCISWLTPRGWYAISPSVAVLYRKIARDFPTLCLDEADRSFADGESGNQDLLAILNSGYKRGATVDRCGGANRDNLESFNVFCPKAFAGIGKLPDTTADRCFPIRLERQARQRCRKRFIESFVEPELSALRDRFAEWAKGEDIKNRLSITLLDSAFPESLNDRAVEVSEALYKIAIIAGGDWYDRIRAATGAIFGAQEDENKATLQLAAIREAFKDDDERLSTPVLIDRLLEQDDSPFPSWWFKNDVSNKSIGKSLAGILKPFGIKPTKFRIEGKKEVRGYERAKLQPVWNLYAASINVQESLSGDLHVSDVSASITTSLQMAYPETSGSGVDASETSDVAS